MRIINSPYDTVAAFEKRVAEYAGAKYGVAVNSCTNALLLSFMYSFMTQPKHDKIVTLPKFTYVGVPYAVLAAGGRCNFSGYGWQGAYSILIDDVHIVDSARRFKRNMYIHDTLYCLSFHWLKHLPVGRGGMILTDDKDVALTLKRMRYDGRTAGVPPTKDTFEVPGYHCYLIPEDAARGLMLMNGVKNEYEDIPWDDYADLSKSDIFYNGY